MSAQADAVKTQNAAAQASTQARTKQQALDYFNAMDNLYLRQYTDQVQKKLQDKLAEDRFKEELKISDMRRDASIRAFDASEQNYRLQLEINREEAGRAQRNLARQFDSTLQDYNYQLDDQEQAFSQTQDQAEFDKDRIDRQKDQLKDQFDLNKRENALSLQRARDQLTTRSSIRDAEQTRQAALLKEDKADITTQENEIKKIRAQADLLRKNREAAVDLEEARAELNRNAKLANIAFGKQGQRLDYLVQAGQIKAQGRKGVSAARSLQTTMALNGLNVARLTNQAFFANKEFDNAEKSAANRRTAIGIEDQISKERESSALAQLTTRGNKLTAQDTYQTAVRNAESDRDTTETTRLATQETLLGDILQTRFDFDTADADQRLDEIAYAVGVATEQLTMNKSRLGKSLIAATATLDDQLLGLEQAKFKADYRAHAARMLPPEFAPDAKAPYDVPLPKYIAPRPGAAPPPAYRAQYIAPPEQSGLSKALGIGGAVLGIAAAPFTAGASAGLAMGLGSAAAAGALGAGLGAASAAGATLSKFTY